MVNLGDEQNFNRLLNFNIVYKSVNFVHKFNISLDTLARLRFILHLEMQACNVLYQTHLYFLYFWRHYLDCQFPKFTKTRIKLHKIAYKMSKNCLRG